MVRIFQFLLISLIGLIGTGCFLMPDYPGVHTAGFVTILTAVLGLVFALRQSRKKRYLQALSVWGILVGGAFALEFSGLWVEKEPEYRPVDHVDRIAFAEPTGVFDHVAHAFIWPLAIYNFYPTTIPYYLKWIGKQKYLETGREMLTDLGGESISFTTEDGVKIDGMFLCHKKYAKNRRRVMEKWKPYFEEEENRDAHRYFQIQDGKESFEEWVNLPEGAVYKPSSLKYQAVVRCFGVGNMYEWNIGPSAMYLARGCDVILFNYRGLGWSEGIPSWKGTSLDGKAAVDYAQKKFKCGYKKLVVHGFSMGSGPAVYAAAKCPNLGLIIDRGFSRMSNVTRKKVPKYARFIKPLIDYAMELHFRYPNEDWIGLTTGDVLIVEGERDHYIPGEHPEKLFKALAKARLGDNPSIEELEAFKQKHWIKVYGGHSPKLHPIPDYDWLSDHKSQEKLNNFLSNK